MFMRCRGKGNKLEHQMRVPSRGAGYRGEQTRANALGVDVTRPDLFGALAPKHDQLEFAETIN
jgi:hypothetical protein